MQTNILLLGIHPGHAFDEGYRQFIHGMAEQMAIGVVSARAYEQERQRADALGKIDRAKTAFFSNVSHEFRTPLQLMLGPLEEVLPEAGERLGSERHQQLLTVPRNALRLLKLVNTLLDFSRLEVGRVQAAFRPTDLAGLTSDVASMFRSAMDSAGLHLSIDCQPIGEPVFVDSGMWEKVQELVTLHGGRVEVKSAVGAGSTFTVTIPRGKDHLPATSIHAEQSHASNEIRADAYVEELLRWLPDTLSAADVAMSAKVSPLGSSPDDDFDARATAGCAHRLRTGPLEALWQQRGRVSEGASSRSF
jgi:K+-sensing histidine kinase KdpD